MEELFSGKTVEEAVEEACKKLGLKVGDFSYEIVEYPNKGFLGIGGKSAKIKVTQGEKGSADAVKEYLEGMLEIMGISEYTLEAKEEGENLNIQLDGEDVGIFMRKQGGAIEALQFLLALYVNKNKEKHLKVVLNINNFREKSQSKMAKVAEKAARQVLKNRRKMTLHAMSAYQRRIIHSTLQNMENISTYSIGEEPNRRVVIAYTGADAVEFKPRQTYAKKTYGNSENGDQNKYGRPTTTPKPFGADNNGESDNG